MICSTALGSRLTRPRYGNQYTALRTVEKDLHRCVTCSSSRSTNSCAPQPSSRSRTATPDHANGQDSSQRFWSQTVLPAALAASLMFSSCQAIAIGPVSVKLEELQVSQTDCGAGISTVGGVTFSGATQKAACLSVSAQASNPSNKPLYNADVFGRIYDVNGEAAIDDTENIRIAYIDEIPPGKTNVSFRLNVPLEQYKLGPLTLSGFKVNFTGNMCQLPYSTSMATGFPGKMLPKTAGGALLDEQSQQDCEITGDCDDLAAAAAIR